MIQIRKEENQKKQKEKKLKVYKVNTRKKTVIALWVLLAVSFLFAVYKNFTAIDIHTIHETKVIEVTILDTHKIENFVENFAEVYYSWEQSAASIDNRTNALKGYLTGELDVYKRQPFALTWFMCQKTFDGKKPYGFLKSVLAYLVRPKLTYAGKPVKLENCLLYTSRCV